MFSVLPVGMAATAGSSEVMMLDIHEVTWE